MLSKEEIRESYKSFDDNRILQLAKNPKGLTKEAIPLLFEEIKLRNLDEQLINWIHLENTPLNQIEKNMIFDYVKHSNCSICNINSDLKAYEFHTVVSGIFFCNNTVQQLIICKSCAQNIRKKNFFKTFFLGWWSREGIFATFTALLTEFFNLFLVEKINHRILNTWIEENNGKFKLLLAEENKKLKIQNFIQLTNTRNLTLDKDE